MRKFFFVILLILLFREQSTAQFKEFPYLDSLNKLVINHPNKDTIRINLLNKLSWEVSYCDPEVSMNLALESIQLSQKIGYQKGLARAYISIGNAYFVESKFKQSNENLCRALDIAKKIGDRITEIDANNMFSADFYENVTKHKENIEYTLALARSMKYNKGLMFALSNKAEYSESIDTAMFYRMKSLELAEKYQDIVMIYHNFYKISWMFIIQGNVEKGVMNSLKGLKILENTHYLSCQAMIINVIAAAYTYQKKNDQALPYYFKALELSKKVKNNWLTCVILMNIGELYNVKKNYNLSIKFASEALEVSKSDRFFESDIKSGSFYMGDNFYQLGKYTEAINWINEGLKYIAKNDYYRMTCLLSPLYKSYEKLNDKTRALSALKLLLENKDSLFAINSTKILVEMTDKYNFDKKDNENQILKQKNDIQSLEISNRNLVAIVLTSLVFALIFLVLFIIRERKKSEKLLLNVLPKVIAKRLKGKEKLIADKFDEASVIFIDIVDFTKLSAGSTPEKIVEILNDVFTKFDKISVKYGLEKIKTIGDCYMAASGIPLSRPDHAESIINMAIEVKETMDNYRLADGAEIKFRTGIDCGPIVAGIIGESKFNYDLWGDVVNTASRMESNGKTGKIQCTDRFKQKIEGLNLQIKFEDRGEIDIKGKGQMRTWFIERG